MRTHTRLIITRTACNGSVTFSNTPGGGGRGREASRNEASNGRSSRCPARCGDSSGAATDKSGGEGRPPSHAPLLEGSSRPPTPPASTQSSATGPRGEAVAAPPVPAAPLLGSVGWHRSLLRDSASSTKAEAGGDTSLSKSGVGGKNR